MVVLVFPWIFITKKTRFNSRAAGRHYYDVNVSLIFSPARIPAALCTWFCIVFWLGSARHGHDTFLCVSVRHNSRDLIRGGRIRSVPLSLASRSRCVPRYRRQLFPLRCHATTHSRSTLLCCLLSLYPLCLSPCLLVQAPALLSALSVLCEISEFLSLRFGYTTWLTTTTSRVWYIHLSN